MQLCNAHTRHGMAPYILFPPMSHASMHRSMVDGQITPSKLVRRSARNRQRALNACQHAASIHHRQWARRTCTRWAQPGPGRHTELILIVITWSTVQAESGIAGVISPCALVPIYPPRCQSSSCHPGDDRRGNDSGLQLSDHPRDRTSQLRSIMPRRLGHPLDQGREELRSGAAAYPSQRGAVVGEARVQLAVKVGLHARREGEVAAVGHVLRRCEGQDGWEGKGARCAWALHESMKPPWVHMALARQRSHNGRGCQRKPLFPVTDACIRINALPVMFGGIPSVMGSNLLM